jgi:2,3-bisphosphoglycerate-independent phosphoglycerate mutase
MPAPLPPRRPVVLVVLDGWGHREDPADNAVAMADTPVFDRILAHGPHCLLRTAGLDVGLPEGQFGNSEVGHMNLGAGRVVEQDLVRIERAVAEGSLAGNAALARLIAAAQAGSGRCHLLGLMSPGGVHSHQDHLHALARLLARAGLEVRLHLFLDGRDTPPTASPDYLRTLEAALAGERRVRIATVSGRFFAMDRDRRWERTEAAWQALVRASGPVAATAGEAIRRAHDAGTTDEFVPPTVIEGHDGIRDGDALLMANYRADRVRQLLDALVLDGFDAFAREGRPRLAASAGMTRYSDALADALLVLFPPVALEGNLGETLGRAGLRQLRIAETEKYPHVTFFFNGGEERPYPGEERILVPSPKVRTYDLQPEMSAGEVTDRLVAAIGRGGLDFILVNFANPDMVGHTGRLDAAVRAVATVDSCLGRVLDALARAGGAALVTADHGNCELMRDPLTGGPHTAHTVNPVPCVLVGGPAGAGLDDGRLADVAPTLLALLGLPRPAAMTGRSLLRPGDAGDAG